MHLKRCSLTLLLFMLAFSANCMADIYSFTDEAGGVHFSNTPNDSRFKVIVKELNPNAVDLQSRAAKPVLSPHAYNAMIRNVASQHNVDEALLHAVIRVESGYNPNAVSRKGAVGLMQIMPETGKRYGVTNLKDPAENIRGGASYLKDLLRMFNNNVSLTLAAYNAGENAVLRYGNIIPPYRETQAYVPKVLSFYKLYSGK